MTPVPPPPPTAAPEAPTALPPLASAPASATTTGAPPPDADGDGQDDGVHITPTLIVAIVAVIVAALMTALWLGARGGDDTPAEPAWPDQRARVAALEDELATTESAREASATEAAELQRQLDDATAQLAAEGSAAEELAAAQAELETANTELAAAQSQIDELTTALDEAEAAAAEPDEPAAFDPATTPEMARWVGELLSSRTGSSRLGQEASTCFGTEVIRAIGLDAVGAGQHNAASGAARQAVIDAMNAAAATCGIDPGLIFG